MEKTIGEMTYEEKERELEGIMRRLNVDRTPDETVIKDAQRALALIQAINATLVQIPSSLATPAKAA